MSDPETLAQQFQEAYGHEIDGLRRMFAEQRYGNWCGPGNVGTEITDDMDACCNAHDNAYGAQSVTSEDPAPSGYYSMWDIEGFKRTMEADATLVACVAATAVDTHFYGPSAAVFRAGVVAVFGARATIAAAAWSWGL
jgi:hypothetical protein